MVEHHLWTKRCPREVFLHRENPVPIISILHLPPCVQSEPESTFYADEPYDFVCLTRSPKYAPETADAYYDAILESSFDP